MAGAHTPSAAPWPVHFPARLQRFRSNAGHIRPKVHVFLASPYEKLVINWGDRATLCATRTTARSRQDNWPTVILDLLRGDAPVHAVGLSARARGRRDAREPPPPLAGRPPPRCARHLVQQPPRQRRGSIQQVCLGLPLRMRSHHLRVKAPRMAKQAKRSVRWLGLRSSEGDPPQQSVAQRALSRRAAVGCHCISICQLPASIRIPLDSPHREEFSAHGSRCLGRDGASRMRSRR